MSTELEKAMRELHNQDVKYAHFCNTWYGDETNFHQFTWFDAQFEEIDRYSEKFGYLSSRLSSVLYDNLFLWCGVLVTSAEIANYEMLWDIERNEVFRAGQVFDSPTRGDDPDFVFSNFPRELMQAARWTAQDSIELLEQLTRHPDEFVRLNVAQNPATPQKLIKILISDVSLNVAEAAREKIEDKSIIQHRNRQVRDFEITHNSNESLIWAAKHQYAQIRLIAARYPNNIPDVFEVLQNDPNWEIQLAVLNHPQTSTEIETKMLQKLVQSMPIVQIQLAKHLYSFSELLELLARHTNDPRVLNRIATNPNTSLETLDFLLKTYKEFILWSLYENPKTSAEQLHYFVGSVNASKPHNNLSLRTKKMLEEFDEYAKRTDLSSNEIRGLTERLRDLWWTNSFYTIARQSNCPADILAEYAEKGLALSAVARNPNTPIHILEKNADSPDYMLRRFTSDNPTTPRALLEKLTLDAETIVSDEAKKQLKERFGVE
jgi:hypothetical protein